MSKNFFENEYKENHLSPYKIKLNGKELVVPYFYILQNKSAKLAQDNFVDDFFDIQEKDLRLYNENKLEPKEIYWSDGKNTYNFFVPFALRNKKMSDSEIVSFIFERAKKKYNRAATLAKNLRHAHPEKVQYYNVKTSAVKTMREEYNAYLWSKTKDKARYMALKTEEILSKSFKLSKNAFSKLNNKNVKNLVHRHALKALIGLSTLATGAKVAQYFKSDSKTPQMEQNFQVYEKTTQAQQTEYLPLKKIADSSLSLESDDAHLNKIQKYNKKCFLENINAIKTVLCFMENYAPQTFKDGKGVPTIGYGCTYLIDENGKGDRDISPVLENQKMSMEESDIQKERYLMFRVLPQILNDINVPLQERTMIATSTFMYVIGPNAFKTSEYLQAMNSGVNGEPLAHYMLGYAKNQGVVKRNLFAYYLMIGKLDPEDFLNLRAEGCYSLEMEDCCAMNGDKVKRDENGLGHFRSDNFEENIKKAKKPRSSVIGKCKMVSQLLPDYVVKSLNKNHIKVKPYLALAQHWKGTSR